MEGKEIPVNIPESSVGLLEHPFSDQVRRGVYIPDKPLDHMGVAKIVRERALEDVVGGKAQEVLRQFRETPELQPFLKDEKFQNWLEQVGVLQTYPEGSEEIQALRSFAIKIGMKKKITETEQLFLMMMSREGRFSSTDRFTDALEGDRWNPENLEEGGMIEIARQKSILQQKLKDEGDNLGLGATICQVTSIGLGIGIRSFGLSSYQELSVLYYLYLNKGKLIPNTALASVLSRRGNGVKDPANSLRVYISRIRKKAAKWGYLFEIETEQDLGYRLVEKNLPKEPSVTPEGHSSSEKEFQDWLGQQIEEIFAVEKSLLEPSVTPEGHSSSEKEFQDWLGQMHVLQAQLDPDTRNFALTPRETFLLYCLYLNRGKWIPMDKLSSVFSRKEGKRWISDNDLVSVSVSRKEGEIDPLSNLIKYISRLRKKAAKWGYLFEIESERGLGYRLVEKQERTAT